VQIKNLESVNIKKENQLWNQTRNQKTFIFLNSEKSTAVYDWSSSDKSSGLCMPILSCSSDMNRTAGVFLVAICIFCCCCVHQRRQCRKNNEELAYLSSPDFKWLSRKKVSEFNETYYF
jgi:hypothetical protein